MVSQSVTLPMPIMQVAVVAHLWRCKPALSNLIDTKGHRRNNSFRQRIPTAQINSKTATIIYWTLFTVLWVDNRTFINCKHFQCLWLCKLANDFFVYYIFTQNREYWANSGGALKSARGPLVGQRSHESLSCAYLLFIYTSDDGFELDSPAVKKMIRELSIFRGISH